MPPPSRLSQVLPQIIAYLDASTRKIFSLQDLYRVLEEQQEIWKLPVSHSPSRVVDALVAKKVLQVTKGRYEGGSTITRYSRKEPSLYAAVCSLRQNSYLSQLTAAAYWGLVPKEARMIFVTHEQGKRSTPRTTSLTQEGIDAAFKDNQRKSTLKAKLMKRTVTLLSATWTGAAGVQKVVQGDDSFWITGPERTLLDLMVRPFYCGGPKVVLSCYREAKKKGIDGEALLHILDAMGYTYPYHQALGFYLERAGYEEAVLNQLGKRTIHYRFYLDYKLKDPAFHPTWQLYYPLELEKRR